MEGNKFNRRNKEVDGAIIISILLKKLGLDSIEISRRDIVEAEQFDLVYYYKPEKDIYFVGVNHPIMERTDEPG